MQKKKGMYIIGIILVCILTTTVLAIWLVSISSTAEYRIYSQEYGGLIVEQDLTGQLVDSLNDTIRIEDSFIFTNEGEETLVSITTRTTNTDESNDSCDNWENDCEYNYKLNTHTILPAGQLNISIATGTNEIVFNLTCVQYTCPQVIIPEIVIEKLPI